MLTIREPSHAAHFEYCPLFGAQTASCSTVHGEPLQRKPWKWRAFANHPGIPSLKHVSNNVFLIWS
jgi:hypothetical protein